MLLLPSRIQIMLKKLFILILAVTLSGCGSTPTLGPDEQTTLEAFDQHSQDRGYRIWKRWRLHGFQVIGWNKILSAPYYAVFDQDDKMVEYLGVVHAYSYRDPTPNEIKVIRNAIRRSGEQFDNRRRAQLAERLAELKAEIALLEKEVTTASRPLICDGEQSCTKAFALTQVFISEHAEMLIQLATDTIIQTYGSTDSITMKATKIPSTGRTEEIHLQVGCDENQNTSFSEASRLALAKECRESQIAYLKAFSAYLIDKMPELQRGL